MDIFTSDTGQNLPLLFFFLFFFKGKQNLATVYLILQS